MPEYLWRGDFEGKSYAIDKNLRVWCVSNDRPFMTSNTRAIDVLLSWALTVPKAADDGILLRDELRRMVGEWAKGKRVRGGSGGR